MKKEKKSSWLIDKSDYNKFPYGIIIIRAMLNEYRIL